MKLRNAYDPNVKTRNLLTTIPGVISLIITVLLGINVITQEQSQVLQLNASTIFEAVVTVVTAVTGIIAIFKATDA